MNKWKYFSPEGVRDLLPAEFLAEEELRRRLTEYLHQSGLRGLGTPEIEFYDLYASGRFAPQEGLFKFIDERGRILCLRYDGTIPLARVLGTSLREHQLPDGFWYLGSVFRYNEQGGGKLRAFQQAGVELIGAGGTRADAEALRLASGFLAATGLQEYTFALGEVSYFKYLLENWQLAGEAEAAIIAAVQSQAVAALPTLTASYGLGADIVRALEMIMTRRDIGVLEDLSALAGDSRVREALDNLGAVYAAVRQIDPEVNLVLDLTLLQSMEYYTGTVFKAYAPGLAYPLLSGGRYDNVLANFSRPAPATGFSSSLPFILRALSWQAKNRDEDVLDILGVSNKLRRARIYYALPAYNRAVELSRELIAASLPTLLDWEDYDPDTAEAVREVSDDLLLYVDLDDCRVLNGADFDLSRGTDSLAGIIARYAKGEA